ncbi:MAG: thiamine diphosphokinase [Ignavibacteriae bacterium]|nr:thiamine diphosphokinase [Ignavibacteriota bacterium]
MHTTRRKKNAEALLICNGEPPGKLLAASCARNASIIVAADGGANVAAQLNVSPDVIIGDLDSVAKKTLRRFTSAELIQVRRQDNTDMEKALDFLEKKKIGTVTIIAATGKRLDHTLGNLSVLWNYTASMRIRVLADDWIGIPFSGKLRVAAKVGTTVSLLPFGACAGITLRGVKYALTNASMRVGEIGVSNVAVKKQFALEVRKGKMLVILLAAPSTVNILS